MEEPDIHLGVVHEHEEATPEERLAMHLEQHMKARFADRLEQFKELIVAQCGAFT
jgi:hypothetical protein